MQVGPQHHSSLPGVVGLSGGVASVPSALATQCILRRSLRQNLSTRSVLPCGRALRCRVSHEQIVLPDGGLVFLALLNSRLSFRGFRNGCEFR